MLKPLLADRANQCVPALPGYFASPTKLSNEPKPPVAPEAGEERDERRQHSRGRPLRAQAEQRGALSYSSNPALVTLASTLDRKFQCLNLLRHVFQMGCESIRNFGRIVSRLRDVIAHLEEAREHRQYRDQYLQLRHEC